MDDGVGNFIKKEAYKDLEILKGYEDLDKAIKLEPSNYILF